MTRILTRACLRGRAGEVGPGNENTMVVTCMMSVGRGVCPRPGPGVVGTSQLRVALPTGVQQNHIPRCPALLRVPTQGARLQAATTRWVLSRQEICRTGVVKQLRML